MGHAEKYSNILAPKIKEDVAKSVGQEAEAEFVDAGEVTNCWGTKSHAVKSSNILVIKKARGDVAKSVKREAEAEFVGVGEDTNCWLTRDHAEESIFVIKTGEDAVKSASREAEAESVGVREVSSCWLTEDHAKKTCQKACTKVYKPVCASNGRTYSNQCIFEIAQCQAKKKGIKLTKISQGKCKAPKHPCNINNGGCNQICRKIGKKAQCRCKSGFILGKDRKTCTQRSCASSVKLDLQLIVDTSGSVGLKNFNLMMKNIADKVLPQFNVGRGKTHVALHKYSTRQWTEFGLDRYFNLAAMQRRVKQTRHRGGWTYTAAAMTAALRTFKRKARRNRKVAKVCIVFTDGKATDARNLPAAQRAWRSYGASVFAVGIGNGINKKSLAVIAGSSARVLKTTFRTLGNIVKPLLNQVCKAIIHPCDKKNGGCQQLCIRRGSRAQCGCRNGFKLLANKKTCGKTCQKACTKEYKPVCASNGRTYSNQCVFEIAQCQAKKKGIKLTKISQGKCKAPKHPCNINNGGCNQICRKIGKKAQCRCKSGFILGKDKKTCTQRSCASSVKLDLQLIVDTSGSVGAKNFNLMMKGIADKVLPQFNIGRGKTHVALHKYASRQWTEFGLDRYFNLAAMQRRVKQTRHRGGFTYTAAAMTAALRTFKRKARRNRKVAKVCIVFTDGKATDARKLPAAQRAWRSYGASVFAVGIGNGINKKSLAVIAGSSARVLQTTFRTLGNIVKPLL